MPQTNFLHTERAAAGWRTLRNILEEVRGAGQRVPGANRQHRQRRNFTIAGTPSDNIEALASRTRAAACISAFLICAEGEKLPVATACISASRSRQARRSLSYALPPASRTNASILLFQWGKTGNWHRRP